MANRNQGILSNQRREVGVKTGRPTHGKNPKAVSQIGSSMGNKATDHARLLKRSVEKMDMGQKRNQSVPLGNELATNVGKGSPGAGRTLYGKSGYQGSR